MKETSPDKLNIDSVCRPPAPGKAEAEELIRYWSGLPHFTRHTDPTKKAYSMSLWCLKTLFEGRQGEKMPLDDDFLSDNGITNEELCHKFTVEEIKAAINKYAYMSSPEYVADKTKWSRSLDYFIYNDKSKRSFFLTLTGDREIPGSPTKSLDDNVSDKYIQTFFHGQNIDQETSNKIIRNVNIVIKHYQDWHNKYGQFMYWHELRGKGFFRYHIQYIELNYQDREDFRADHLGNMTFKSFIAWLHQFHGINYEYTRDEITAMKEKFAKDTIKIAEIKDDEQKRLLERENWLQTRVYRDSKVNTSSEIEPFSVPETGLKMDSTDTE